MKNSFTINELIEKIRKAKPEDNLKNYDIWVKTSNLRGYAIAKGLKSFIILNQKGEIPQVKNPSRERVGLWFDYLGFLRKILFKVNDIVLWNNHVKYVSGLGFLGFHYVSSDYDLVRIDFVSYNNPTYYIIISNASEYDVKLTLSIIPEIRFMWPSTKVLTNLEYSLRNNEVTVWKNGEVGSLTIKCLNGECNINKDGTITFQTMLKPKRLKVFTFSPHYGKLESIKESSRASRNWLSDFKETYLLYRRLAYETLNINVGDFELEKAFIWSKISMYMLYSETSMGNGWFAGAPVFSWFFGRDSAWTGFAALTLGLIEEVLNQLNLLAKFQTPKGQIPHEIVLLPNIGSKIKTGYMSIDSTLLWIILLKEFYDWSLRKDVIAKNYEKIVKAYYFLRDVCDIDRDLLLENQPEKLLIGWPERWANRRRGKCVEINAYWLEALRALEKIAVIMGDKNFFKEISKNRVDVERLFNKTFWNETKNFYRDHVNSKDSITIFSIMPLYYCITSKAKAKKVLERIRKNDFKTQWGIRSVSSEDPIYDGGYHSGAIWPLHTGWVIIAALNYGEVDFALEMLRTLINQAFKNSDPGRINEVYSDIDGNEMGQFIQAWSSAALIYSLTKGFFKIIPNPERNEAEITIYPLKTHENIKLSNIRVWDNVFNLDINFSNGRKEAIIKCDKCLDLKLRLRIFFRENRFIEKIFHLNGKVIVSSTI